MEENSKLPKTLFIFAKKGRKSGFLRFKSVDQGKEIVYVPNLVKTTKEASRFINFNNTKRKALDYALKYGFDETRVFDQKLMKFYHVKKTN